MTGRGPGRRAGAFGAALAVAVATAEVVGSAAPAAAAAPVRTAWWNTAPAGVFPAQTAPGQLAVSEGATGAMAVAAVAYAPGAAPTGGATLTLAVDGSSSFGPGQVQACPVKDPAAGWKEGGGQTGSPPAYDCSRSAAGTLASSGASVAFTLGAGQAEPDGSFDLVILPAAGALPFQLVLDPPGSSSLAARPASPGAPAPPASAQPAPAPSGSTGPAPGPAAGSAPGPSTAPSGQGVGLAPSDTTGLPSLPAPAGPSAASSPASGATTGPAPARSAPVASGPIGLPGTTPAGRSSPAGKILGFAALLIVLVLYSQGFGVLGGRIRPLSSRYGRRQAGGSRVSA